MPPPSGSPPARRKATGAAPAAAARPARRARPAAKLVCTAGPASGQEFPLEGDEVSIGRANDNPVSVPDTSVSRKHALVRKTELGGWAVSDLGSGNGTTLNGEAIADETELNDGDVIGLGDSEFAFSAGGGATAEPARAEAPAAKASPAALQKARPPVRTARTGGPPERSTGRGARVRTSRMAEDPAEAKARKRKLFIRVGGAAVVVLALLVGWKAIDNKRKAAAAVAARAEGERKGELAAVFQEAKNLVRQGKWTDAKAKLEELQGLDPDFEATSVANYLAIAGKEIPNEKALSEAAKAVADKKVGAAATALNKVKDTTQSARYENLKSQLDALFTEKTGEARTYLPMMSDLSKMEALLALAEDLLVARPDDRDATEFKKTAEQAIYKIKNPTKIEAPPDRPWIAVQQLYRQGDNSGALNLAEACAGKFKECRNLVAMIQEFNAKVKNLESLKEDDLGALYLLDKKISGGESSEQAKPIKVRVAAQFYLQASRAKTTGNWTRAIEYARRVLEADPAHPGAQSIMSEARSQAKDVYLRGYQLKDSDQAEAVRLFKEVLAMTPKDDEYHQKAETRIQEINKQ